MPTKNEVKKALPEKSEAKHMVAGTPKAALNQKPYYKPEPTKKTVKRALQK